MYIVHEDEMHGHLSSCVYGCNVMPYICAHTKHCLLYKLVVSYSLYSYTIKLVHKIGVVVSCYCVVLYENEQQLSHSLHNFKFTHCTT